MDVGFGDEGIKLDDILSAMDLFLSLRITDLLDIYDRRKNPPHNVSRKASGFENRRAAVHRTRSWPDGDDGQ